MGELGEKVECRFRSKSASETSTGSEVVWVKEDEEGGGGIVVELKDWCCEGIGRDMLDTEGLNLTRGEAVDASLERIESMEGCPGVVSTGGFASRPFVASDVYMTATLVEGEFMVPVRDHPIAA